MLWSAPPSMQSAVAAQLTDSERLLNQHIPHVSSEGGNQQRVHY